MPAAVDIRSCPVCSHNDRINLYNPKHSPGPINRCLFCGMIYVSPVEDSRAIVTDGPVISNLNEGLLNSAELEDISDCWELSLLDSESEKWVSTERNATAALELIELYRQPPGQLLDFGCGWGFLLGLAKERGWNTYGLDPLPGHSVHARSKFGATVVTDILRDNTFPQNSFDVVTSFQVFEHLPDPAGDLDRLYKMIKPGGILLIEVPNIDTWSVRLFKKHHRHFVQDHLNFFSPETLKYLLENKSFQVQKTYFPTRYITIRHLVKRWFGGYLWKSMTDTLEEILRGLNLWGRVIGINLGDILAIIAQKTYPQ